MTTSRSEEQTSGAPPSDLLSTPPPRVAVAVVARLLRERYGLAAQVGALAGERDANFLATPDHGRSHVFKVFNAAETAATRALQIGALRHVADVGVACAVPRLVATRDGADDCEVEAEGGRLRGILIGTVPGEPVDLGRAGPGLRRELGRVAAVLDTALEGYDPPAARRVLLWDPMQLGRMAGTVAAEPDPARRRWLAGTVERFLGETRPQALRLPAQVIHNDLNGGNVLRAGETLGVIDFGDLVHAPRISEVAIAASYAMTAGGDPLAAMGDVLAGYAAARPLAEAEVALLPDLALARLALRILMYRWRAGLFPALAQDLGRRGAAAGRLVDQLGDLAPGVARDAMLARWRGLRAS